ncbi:hypothetical protein MUG87_19245 [Ectobacillus sp. JY-23]|uniref:hypothetical protein n=1 Tax=Ectobacillus sp. JY-23 TaxID=2933872 RepID=UPI001FF61E00|nr:hypothetical protein [Ectobacillus sp. JY-23]UOY92518.1 hypothetical protein MUG87_19245 [Ectobacillus sp. JY-23]
MSNYFAKKATATFVTVSLSSCLFGAFSIEDTVYEKGAAFIGWFFLFTLYIGAIVIVYGNLVSIAVDFLQSR